MTLQGKRILLIIGGGIAAYKSLELIRRLKERNADVRAILTAGGAEFTTALSVASLSGEKVYSDLFSLTDEAEMGHIRLSREADLVVVAPATADLMGKMAAGLAGDLATTALLATDKPVMIAPAMNVEMWGHPATQRNAKILGIFVRLAKRDGKPVYLDHLPRVARLFVHDLEHPALAQVEAWARRHAPAVFDEAAA